MYIDPNGKQSKFWTRFWGGAQMLGGALEVAGSGIRECFSGGTETPLMVPLFLNGVDNFQARATPAQRQQIQKAIEDAAEKEIKMNVRVVN